VTEKKTTKHNDGEEGDTEEPTDENEDETEGDDDADKQSKNKTTTTLAARPSTRGTQRTVRQQAPRSPSPISSKKSQPKKRKAPAAKPTASAKKSAKGPYEAGNGGRDDYLEDEVMFSTHPPLFCGHEPQGEPVNKSLCPAGDSHAGSFPMVIVYHVTSAEERELPMMLRTFLTDGMAEGGILFLWGSHHNVSKQLEDMFYGTSMEGQMLEVDEKHRGHHLPKAAATILHSATPWVTTWRTEILPARLCV
jgi:hypothetical protein